jgi:hypothetical protein
VSGARNTTAILSACAEPGCETLTIGPVCITHDRRPRPTIVRGRPFVRPAHRVVEAAGLQPAR